MYGLRHTDEAREEAVDVQARHGSRKSGLPPSGLRRKTASPRTSTRAAKREVEESKTPTPQGDLFA
jgi:deoxyribodipyrimidine photo-lyase